MGTLARIALSIGAAAALLAGCGASQLPVRTPGTTFPGPTLVDQAQRSTLQISPNESRGGKFASHGRSQPLLYVSNFNYKSKVTVYPANARSPAPVEVISDGLNFPTGNCLDSNGTLYVANDPASSSGWITEYPFGKTKPSELITEGVSTPAFCAIDSSGNLWVTNIGGPNVTEYLAGSKTPHTVLKKGIVYPVGIAFDRSGDLYVANRPVSGGSDVAVYTPGSKTPSRSITDGITSPVGIAIDENGVLYVANIREQNVEEYMLGEDQPFRTISQGLPTPGALTVNSRGWLYVANGAGSNHRVVEFAPGSITPSTRHVSKALRGPSGVAIFPPVLP